MDSLRLTGREQFVLEKESYELKWGGRNVKKQGEGCTRRKRGAFLE